MKKIVFVIQDRCIGGGTSSLSSWYNNIKSEYNVEVFQLTDYGDASISYSDVLTMAPWLCRYYYGSPAMETGWKKLLCILVKTLSIMFPFIIKFTVRKFEKTHKDVNCVISFGEGPAAYFTSHIKTIRKITWMHYDITHYPYDCDDLSLYSKFDRVICVAQQIANGMKQMYPTLSDKIIGIHNLIDPERVFRLSKESIRLSDKYLFDIDHVILSIGRICEVKGFYNIPLIASMLKTKNIKFRWIIIGPANDTAQLQLLQEGIITNNLAENVIWIGSRENPYPYLSHADILVSLSSTEACPMVFLEAKILNKPIVSSPMLTAAEFLMEGNDGYIVPIDQMSDTIAELLTKPHLYAKLGKNSNISSHNLAALNTFRQII